MSLKRQWVLSIVIVIFTAGWLGGHEWNPKPFDRTTAALQPGVAASATPVGAIPSASSTATAGEPEPAATETADPFPEVTNHPLPTTRLLPAVRATTSGAHAFLQTDRDGSPVTWSPCAAIHYAVNTAEMPANGIQVLHAAIAEISAATGLKFVQAPDTHAVPWGNGADLDNTTDGLFPPVLVDWATEKEYSPLTGHGGVASPFAFVVTNWPKPIAHQYVSGQVTLSADVFRTLAGHGAVDAERGLLVHEFGHLVGLGHVNDSTEIMNPTVIVTRPGPGDLQALAEAGSGRCTF